MKEACQAVTLSRMSRRAILDVTGKVEEKFENLAPNSNTQLPNLERRFKNPSPKVIFKHCAKVGLELDFLYQNISF